MVLFQEDACGHSAHPRESGWAAAYGRRFGVGCDGFHPDRCTALQVPRGTGRLQSGGTDQTNGGLALPRQREQLDWARDERPSGGHDGV